jgi:CheY-like chemotaxis protein
VVSGRILVIEGDAPLAAAMEKALEAMGFYAAVCSGAQDGFRKAVEDHWDCIVCNPELPDIDGLWVARRVRTEPGPIAKVPILFVGELGDKSIRSQALGVGVDVFIARPPASEDDIVAQVSALVAMSRRLDSEESAPSSMSSSAAVRGDLSAFPLASMLMMFEMERRSGIVQVVAQSGKRCVLTITDGFFSSTESAGQQRPPLEVLREVLGWRAGRFSFHPRESGTLPAPRASMGALVLEAMRLEDEAMSPLPELDSNELVDADTKAGRDRKVLPELTGDKVQIREGTEHKKLPPTPPTKAKVAPG